MNKGKVYLSGPDRLLKDRVERFAGYEKLCEKYDLILLKYPEELFKFSDTLENNRKIAEERIRLIKECDIIIANAMDFRSYVEPYSEVGLELGIAFSLGKKLYCYVPDLRTCAERYPGTTHVNENGKTVDENGIGFEPGPLNVMLEQSSKLIKGDLEDALKVAHDDYYGGED